MTFDDHIQDARAPAERRRLPPKKIAGYAGLAVLAIVLACLSIPGIAINPLIGGRITREFGEAYPAHTLRIDGLNYNAWTNRLSCDSVRITDSGAKTVARASRIAVTGVDRLPLLFGGGITPSGVGGARAEAWDVVLAFEASQHELRCDSVRVSAADSSLTIQGLRYGPPGGDKGFFAGSSYRKTRFRFSAPELNAAGLAWIATGKGCRARTLRMAGAALSVLINKEKPVNGAEANPRMPAELLASLGGELQIDSVLVRNARIAYQERFTAGSDPAALTWENVQVTATGIGDAAGRGDTLEVRARGNLMGAGAMALRMSIPVASREFSFRYSGSLGEMNLSRLNPFLEISEGIRIKTGVLHAADFDIVVSAGTAGGVFRATYEELGIVAIDPRTGSDGDIIDTFISLVANNVTLRTNSMPDGSNPPPAGAVSYAHGEGETFLEFAWFGLRSGISDAVGF